AARFVGPALAGLIIGLGETLLGSTLAGVAFAFWINGLSYIGVIYGLFLMNTAELYNLPSKKQPDSILKNLKEGFGYIYRSPQIRSLILLVGMMGTFGVNYNVWIPVLARTYLHVGAEGYGVLMAALGMGALGMALTLAVQGHRPTQRWVLAMVLLFGLAEVGVAWSEWYIVSFFFMLLIGLSSISVFTSSNSSVQDAVPAALRGRVMGIYMLVFAGTTPIGSLLMGWLASWLGTPFSMTVGGLLSVCAIPLFWLSKRSADGVQPA
ncbi:MAG: MFS transporter, partial [Chloroflexota bacterium]